jgi:hypothetical protein
LRMLILERKSNLANHTTYRSPKFGVKSKISLSSGYE